MKKILIGTAIALGVIATPSAASASPIPPETSVVTVTVTTNNGGVQVGTGIADQPLVGASADNNGVCVGFSYQVPQCLAGDIG